MKKYIISSFILCTVLLAQAQVNFQIASVSGNKNDTVSVAVTTTGFNNVVATQYSLNYDSLVLAFIDVTKTANYDVNFASHVGSASVKNGQLGFTWDAPGGVGKSLANGTLLFTIKFKLIGKECDSSFIKLANKPTSIEVLDGNFNNLTLTAPDGKVKINGAGCQGGGPPPDTSGLQIIASTETTPQGVVKCIKVTAKNFKNIQTAQFTMHWDKTVATFDTLNSGAMTLSWGQNYAALPDRSGVGINWDAGANPVTIADGVTLFEVCLKPVGAPGTSTNITFDGTPVLVEITDGNGNVVTPKFTTGKLSITSPPAANINLYVRDTTVEEGGEFCIPIRVDGFKCVQSFQFSIKFDNTKLKFNKISGIGTAPLSLGGNNFNIVKDSIRVTWDAQSGPVDLPNGGILFSVCFESIAATHPFDTKLLFTDLLGSPLEFSDCNSNNFGVTKGEPDWTVAARTVVTHVTIVGGGSTVPVKCFDDCNGSVTGLSLKDGKGPFEYEWRLQPSGVVVSTVLAPTDLCAGKYKLFVIDRGDNNYTTSTPEYEITSPEILACTATITHVSSTSSGKIDITISGGTPQYSVMWFNQSGTKISSNEDLSNRSAGTYTVMITDSKGCVKNDTFVINPAPLFLDRFTLLDSNKCFGDCRGKVTVSIGGGKIPYTYLWSNGDKTATADSICKGDVTVTVTDATGATLVETYKTISEPDRIDITLDSIRKSNGTNGGVFVTIKGGTLPYKTYQWRNTAGNVVSNVEDLLNVPSDTFTLCVTDKNDCVQCVKYFVSAENSTPPTIKVDLKIEAKANGQAISCVGRCDGKLVVTVTHSDPRPHTYRYRWSHDAALNSNVALGLCPGSYSVTVTDEGGNSGVSSNITIQDAPSISLTAKRISCASTNTSSDGVYEAIVTGASQPISYSWCSGSTLVRANDLSAGECTLTITDVNNCTATETFTVCVGNEPEDCYKGRLAISPNGDGFNEVLEITCANLNDNVLTIYDRWGNQVYSKINYVNDWNGKDEDGDDLTEGTYMWVLKVKEPGKNDAYFKGTVTIVR